MSVVVRICEQCLFRGVERDLTGGVGKRCKSSDTGRTLTYAELLQSVSSRLP